MKFDDFKEKVLKERAISSTPYEFFIGQDKLVHIVQGGKETGALDPKAFQGWLQKRWPSKFQQIWQQLVASKKFSGNQPPEDMDVDGEVSQGAGD